LSPDGSIAAAMVVGAPADRLEAGLDDLRDALLEAATLASGSPSTSCAEYMHSPRQSDEQKPCVRPIPIYASLIVTAFASAAGLTTIYTMWLRCIGNTPALHR